MAWQKGTLGKVASDKGQTCLVTLLHPETLACWSLSLRPGCGSAGAAVEDVGLRDGGRIRPAP